jgi:hypothetical protein
MPTCHRHYPGRSDEACPLVYLHRLRPSLCNSQVGSCNCFFGACSAFTHVMACTLAESPSDPLHRKLRQLRCLRCRLDCYRVERTSSRAGVAPAEVQRLSTAHVESRTGAVALASRWLLGCFRMTRLNPVWRNSVSCSRSSNRTGRFPASGSRKRLTMLCVTPPATSEHNSGWLDSSSIPMSCVASCVRL